MRLAALAATTLLASATTALAAPASVSVSVAPDLQKRFEKDYGVREAQLLTGDLKSSVEKQLARRASYQDARIELTLVDVKPNRPTFKQLGDTPGLSMQSRGIGGADIKGRIIAADGHETPLRYHWYETDIREVRAHWVWTDAETTFDQFARRLAKGEQLAAR